MTTFAGQHDHGAKQIAIGALDAAVITAGAGNDGVAVNGNGLDRKKIGYQQGPGLSAQLLIPYKAVLAATKTLSLAVTMQHDSASGFGTAATATIRRVRHVAQGATGAGTVTDLSSAISSGAFPATVVATGDTGGTTERGCLIVDLDLGGLKEYVRAQVTADLSATGTDTVALSGALSLGGFVEAPITS